MGALVWNSPKLQWLGDATEDAEKCFAKGGETRDRVTECSADAAAAAAGGVCLATPGFELAAPLCAGIGREVAEKIAGPIYDVTKAVFEGIFGGDEGLTPAEAQQGGMYAVEASINSYKAAVSQVFHAYARHDKPITYAQASELLDKCGAKHALRDFVSAHNHPGDPYFAQAKSILCWTSSGVMFLMIDGVEPGSLNTSCSFILADAYAELWRNDIAIALSCALQGLVNRIAVDAALAQQNEVSASTSSTKRSYFWPVVVPLALVSGLILWAVSPLGR